MRKKFMKDNRGAALVSIMIAVAFIAILASALLYISFNNFQMKTINYQSKVNFYEAESDLVVASTAIRNAVYNDASNPMGKLKEVVGYKKDGDIERYNPEKIASLVYSSVTPGADPSAWNEVVDGKDVTFTAKTLTGSNFIVVDESAEIKKVTLEDIVIKHVDPKTGATNTITTDLVYRIKQDTKEQDPGGIGEFSILMDSPVSSTSTYCTRITTYGNVFVGPGTYQYVSGTNTVDPSAATAMTLTDKTFYTVNGDYMVVFGDIILEDTAVLNIANGNLTVYGDIILRDNASFICSGNLFFPEGTKPNSTDTYGIKIDTAPGQAGKANNVIPNILYTDQAANCGYVKVADYNIIVEELNLHNTDRNDDGILNQIIKSEHITTMKATQECDTNNSRVEVDGLSYRTYYNGFSTTNLNGGEAQQCNLMFNTAHAEMQNTSVMNTTLISFNKIEFANQHNFFLSQIGSNAFDELTSSDQKLEAGSMDIAVNDIFEDDANITVNKILKKSGGSSGDPMVEVTIGYENWTRE